MSVLQLLGCCNKNTINWVAYKQQKFAFHSSRDSGVLQRALFVVHRGLSFHNSMAKGAREFCVASFIKALIPIMRGVYTFKP